MHLKGGVQAWVVKNWVVQVHLKGEVQDRVEQNWVVQMHLKGGVQDWVVLELLCMRHCSSNVSPVVGSTYHIWGRGPSLLCRFVSWLLSFLTEYVGNQPHVAQGSPCSGFLNV